MLLKIGGSKMRKKGIVIVVLILVGFIIGVAYLKITSKPVMKWHDPLPDHLPYNMQ